ncbi:AzlD domain-containing protein [Aneurinibacillus sp. Ricciae_BoGa-3]|uniref:AzlD domain-containing protein n=1 Tax=Aneurinibacillus sp. Ricciae_BoGa-3 TaxID=3022697 RepID=UPI0023420A7C|nr:AzlD domain-containing protein [Aneurinibacillus sp. Ricciae_BoGa-3]WCK56402.1 AzlD domain-containing protein [Aneurinibacillus sp. Ricciae_BoGa-3]
MNDRILIVIILMAIITYLTRFPMLLISARKSLPSWVERGLKMVPVGVFTSLTIPHIVFRTFNNSWNPDYAIAGMCSLIMGLWKKQIFLALLTGVGVIAIWRFALE